MLDIKFIRENQKKIEEALRKKKIKFELERLLEIDDRRRVLIKEVEELYAVQNKRNAEVAKATPPERKKLIDELQEVKEKIKKIEPELKNTETAYEELMYFVPNVPADDVPEGKDETANRVIRKVGEPAKFDFQPKDHMELGAALDIIDTETAARVAGSRFNYLKNEAALLEYAIVRYVFDVLRSEKTLKKIADSIEKGYPANAFVPVVPPVMIRPDVYRKMARLSEEDKDERYYLPQDDMYLIGSAEHTLGPMHMDKVFEEKNLPLRYVGFSTSFRRESGSYGKDVKGIFRVHQFDKIEMETFAAPENGIKEQNFIIAIQEYLVNSFGLPYQVVMLCTGDMGKPDARQVDIECWLPGQNRYRETHTSDYMTDYQARRLNTRVKRAGGKTEFVHMNDATAFAIGRILIAILENYQQADGSVKVPEVLIPYCGFKAISTK